jgi:hypothetical protein
MRSLVYNAFEVPSIAEGFGPAFSLGSVDGGVVSDGRFRVGSLLVPGLVSVWAKPPGISRKLTRENTLATMISFLMLYLLS